MKNLSTNKAKRLLAIMLCLLTAFSAMPLTAFAWTGSEGVTCSSSFGDYYVGYDGGQYYSASTYDYLVYDSNGNTSLHTMSAGNARRKYMLTTTSGQSRQVYCAESGVSYQSADNAYTSKNGTNSSYFKNLPYSAQYGIMLATVYGWEPGRSTPVSGTNADDYSLATQIIIWEYQQQLRTSPTSLHTNSYGVRADNYFRTIDGRPAEKCYNWILSQMAQHATVPSFASSTSSAATVHTLKYDTGTGKYSLTLTDTNNTLADLKITGGSGITVTRNGNKYTITSSEMLPTAVTLTATKNTGMSGDDMLIWGRPGYQTMLTGVSDPVVFYVKVNSETYGTGKIIKTSEDGKVSGITFTVTGNGVNKTVTTGADGTVEISDLLPGVYTVTEQNIDKYEPQSVQRVTIVSGHTSTVTFNNVLKRGGLKVTKTSEDGLVEGVKFHLYGTSLSGLAVDEYAVTDKSGVAIFENVLISGSTPYTLEEVDTAIRYVIPPAQTATVNWNEVTNKSFTNILKKWSVTVTKSDKETGLEQGDATLAGAVYGIYNGNQLVDTYVTDTDGQFTTKYYICGDNWTVREITPSEGYLLDTTVHHIGAEAKNFVIERNSVANNVTEQVIKGKIAIIKHTDDGSTQIETPEEGAVFQIYLASAGSYDKAKSSERDVLTCDENGFAQSKMLPYGVYTVHQTKGWDGRELMKDFRVYISADGVTYRYLINNANFESYIKVVKVDAETGKTIPYAGAGFQIYRPDGSLVTQTFTYPTVTTIDTFYTNDQGYLVTPEKLEYGTGYSLVEVQAPYGYVLDSTPIKFNVVQENSTDENGITVINVERPNMAQKGVINISKTGEVFSGVTESNGIYQPVYEVQGLPGAVYDIIAAEDIVTPDGTVRAKKGDVLDKLTTDSVGTAKSRELYLGRYSVIECTAPYGMVLNEEVHEVELTYAGQEISVTETATSFYNERQRVEISLDKSLEQDEQFGIGMNGEIFDVTFGLFATEDVTAADGSIIPANGLIEIISLDENGHGISKTDLPFGSFYLKELSTNAAYRPFDTQYPVVFEYAGQDTALVKLSANDGKAIENELLRGSLKVIKTFEGRETPIVGVPFTITGKTVTGIDIVINAVTDENGEIRLENLPIGEFVVKELESELTAGYVLSPEQTAVVAADEIAEMTINNELMRGDLRIIKTFEGKFVPVAGVKFTVTGKTLTGEDYNGEFETDEDGCIFIEGLLAGDYKVKEIASDLTVGYVLSEEQAAVVAHEQVTELQIENKLIRGNVKLIKTDKDGGAKLAGAVFDLYDPDGNLISSYTTDKNGEIFIENLPYGFGYKLVESKAPEGYKLEKTEISFDITENGATVELSAVNEKAPTPDNPKTGDDSNVGLWIALAGISAAALIGLGVASKRRKKKIEETEE